MDYYVPQQASVCSISDQSFGNTSVHHLLGAFIKIPTAPPEDVAYQDLPLSETQRKCIIELIETMAYNHGFHLIFKRTRLRQIEADIVNVHPLKFLSVIFSNSNLKNLMKNIREDVDFKWAELMNGLGRNLTREAIKGKLDCYINEFALEINVAPEAITPYFQSRDWDRLVLFLIE